MMSSAPVFLLAAVSAFLVCLSSAETIEHSCALRLEEQPELPKPPKEECPENNKLVSYEKTDDKLRILHWNIMWMFSPASLRASWQVEDEQLKNKVYQCPVFWQNVADCTERPEFEHPANGKRPKTKHQQSCGGKAPKPDGWEWYASQVQKVAKDVSKGTSKNQGVTCINQVSMHQSAANANYFNTNITKEHGDGLDVISLSEIDGCHVLKDLLDLSGLDRNGFVPYHITGNDFRSYQQVGFLSRINPVEPITTTRKSMTGSEFPATVNPLCQKFSGVERGREFNYKEEREGIGLNKVARMDVNVKGIPITILTIHLKSIPTRMHTQQLD
ncbi:unnamed protein product [Vitrella brassicaformis CCMP3155]|uniref:Uncharacterized protein n=1 Tax=Vitrella brassicaformis (strain CCMP3155) TaxID=1169540 RepID=A0A0G4FRE7_VITBC|nr:unnamed protein product [Vitrella brassicaformis CCMP3155]|eukprot:CEM16632.1 unnamed protein product [Vitrella brassicaformis CCMP3155]